MYYLFLSLFKRCLGCKCIHTYRCTFKQLIQIILIDTNVKRVSGPRKRKCPQTNYLTKFTYSKANGMCQMDKI